MASTGRWLLFFSQILIHLIALSIAEFIAGSDYIFHRCIDSSGNYTSDSMYSSNLNTSLSSISSHAKNNPYGFYNSSFGVGNDRANALALCRGDSEPDICATCVKNITRWLREVCPSQKEAVGWYHGYYKDCLLHYSNNIVLHNLCISPDLKMVTPSNVSDVAEFVIQHNEDLRTLLDSLRSRAASGGSLRKFATGNISGPNNSTIYGMVQCTPDLSAQECDSCLDGAARDIPECCNGNVGARVLRPSCIVRYEPVPFYREILADAPAPAPPPPPSSSPSVNPRVTVKLSSRTIIAIATTIGVSVLLLAIGFCYAVRRRRAKNKNNAVAEETAGSEITTIQSLQFDLGIIEAATNNFSDDNKIGEGGFGMVYKGTLANGQEIAVKRLSKTSGQGALEFKNEVALLAKLQHRHLVRLLGFCLEGGEKILIYEYVPNKSLDYFLFDPEKRGQLDWSRRYKVIGETARGMLYLHEDSRIRIIHRDLKASNILLDSEMSAKVSDFGLAKLFDVNQTHGKTSRIVGTFGYMSPEYAMHGQFSVKSDVFSFGVLVLEIISGKRNSSFCQPEQEQAVDLLCHAWKLWREGKPLELMDATLKDSYTGNELIRCIHMGLLCVQEDVDARPTMATIVLMLSSYSVSLPSPKKPPFFLHSIIESRSPKGLEPDQSTGKLVAFSVDDSSITHVYPDR